MNLLDEFAARREQRLRKQGWIWQPRNPNPSDMTDCRRYQVFRVLCWEMRPLPDVRGMEAMEDGRLAEEKILRQLVDEGWEIVEQQASFEIFQPLKAGGQKQRIISGRIDGKLRLNGKLCPIEVKTTEGYTLERIDDAGDLLDSPWTRRWYRQLQLYCLGENSERAILILAHRGQRKPIEVALDYDYAEKLLSNCVWAVGVIMALQGHETKPEDVDAALNGWFMEPYHHDFNACRICPFRDRTCFPPEPETSAAQVRPDLAEAVERYLAAKPHASEYTKLHKQIKAATEGFPQTVAGDYVIEGEIKTRHMKAKPAVGPYVSESWSIEVRKVGEKP